MPLDTLAGFLIKHCQMAGIQSRAVLPKISGATGTLRHARKARPSLRVTSSNSFIARARRCSSWGKKNIPTPYSRSPPMEMFSSSATLEKNLWLICSRMPTPSPVLPSASLPARCSRCSTMVSASLTVWWLLRPWISTTAPMPQASCSNLGSYRPAGAVRSLFQRSIPIPSYLYHRCAKRQKAPLAGRCACQERLCSLAFYYTVYAILFK